MSARRLLFLVLAGTGLYLVWRQSQASNGGYSISLTNDMPLDSNTIDTAAQTIIDSGVNMWAAANVPAQYKQIISDTEQANGIPDGLLARLLYQESRFNPNAIGPVTKYGQAKGIAQMIDTTAQSLGVTNPFDPSQEIPAAGRYLAGFYRQFGSWQTALAAYNWGPGNVARKGTTNLPPETANYVAQITSDVPVA